MVNRIKEIDSPYASFGDMFDNDEDVKDMLEENEDLDKYNLYLMQPVVTYDDFLVCIYDVNGKLYYISADQIVEVEPIAIFEYNDDFNAVDKDGNVIGQDNLPDYYDCCCCGEADDMSCYIYFE